MHKASFNEMRDKLVSLMGERLATKGVGFEAKYKNITDKIPPKIKKQFAVIVDAETKMKDPKLAAKVDAAKIGMAYGLIRDYLEEQAEKKEADPKAAKKRKGGGRFVTTILLQLIVLSLLIVGFFVWKDARGGL